MTNKLKIALIATIAVAGIASPALAQSYSFPTYAYLHPETGNAQQLRVVFGAPHGLYNSVMIPKASSAFNSNQSSAAGRGNSH